MDNNEVELHATPHYWSSMNVFVKRLNEEAELPTYGTQSSAGADLYSTQHCFIHPRETVMIHTGLAIALPEGTVGLVMARSGLATKRHLAPANKVGVIDSDYRGELMVALHNHGDYTEEIFVGERIAQLLVMPYYKVMFTEVDSLDDTERGVGGFGSTGV